MRRRRALELLAAAGVAALLPRSHVARAAIPAATEQALAEAKLIYVATRRQGGTPSEAAPIWFHFDGEEIFFTTSPDSWKARRIAAGSPLYIWVGSADGPYVQGEAERVTDPEIVERMGRAYEEKYWIAWLGLFRPRPDRVTEGKTLAYRVRLSEGEPPTPAA
jgi:PPOX class probable F420-dependent enzyme